MTEKKELVAPSRWQGQFLGRCRPQNVLGKKKQGKAILYTFLVAQESWTCEVRLDRYSLLALADECAGLFGFTKTGTTTIVMGKTRYSCSLIQFHNLKRIEISMDTQIVFRRRLQDFLVWRWVFGVPVDAKKDLFFHGTSVCARFTTPQPSVEGLLTEDWFVDTIKDSKLRLLQNRKSEVLVWTIHDRIKEINPAAVIHLRDIARRLSPLG